MITSLRQEKPPTYLKNDRPSGIAGAGISKDDDSDDCCHIHPTGRHTNANCFDQHPDKAPEDWKKKSRKGQKSKDKRTAEKGKDKKSKDKGVRKKTATAIEESSDNESLVYDSEVTAVAAIVATSTIAQTPRKDRSLTRNDIIFDSGASKHFFNDLSLFKDLKTLSKPVGFSQAVGKSSLEQSGTVDLELKYKGKKTLLTLHNVFYSPKSDTNLISAERLWLKKEIHLDRPSGLVMRNGIPIGSVESVYSVLAFKNAKAIHASSPPQYIRLAAPATAKPQADTMKWHQRLGHVGSKILSLTKAKLSGLELIDTAELGHCEPCKLARSQRIVSRIHRQRPNHALDEVHIDLVGSITPPDLYGNQWILMITDARTRYRWAIPMKRKEDTSETLKSWLRMIHTAYKKTPVLIFTDGGKEFKNKDLEHTADAEGIRWDTSAPYTPEQNGIAESSNKVILSKARTMIIEAGFLIRLWNFAVQHSQYITNRIVNIGTKEIPLYDFKSDLGLTTSPIDHTNTMRFGCKAYKHIDKNDPKSVKSAKFAPRADVYWFVGFQKNTSTNYLLWRPTWSEAR